MANTFYSVDAETGENTNENLWTNGQPKMPAFLAKRAQKLNKKFYSYDKEQRNKQAFENREQNLKAIQGKAKKFIAKAEAVQKRKQQILGESNSNTTFTQAGSPFKMRGNLAQKASEDVVQHQKSTSPVNVASNLEAKFATFETNRSTQLSKKVASAQRDLAKVERVKKVKQQLNAQAMLTQGFVNTTVTTGKDGEGVQQTYGWGSPMKLPPRLAARAEALQQRFRYSPTNMQQKAEANRQAFLDGIVAKAAKVSEKREMVYARRAAMTQEHAGMYTVFSNDENDDATVAPSAGWNQRAKLPAKLRKRYQTLRRKFKYDPVQREMQAEKNRETQLMNVRSKARDFSRKAEEARDRKALAEGNEFTFSFSADPEDNEQKSGWGKQRTKLPRALAERCASLQQQFKSEPFAVRNVNAKKRREAFNESKAAKARTFSGAPMGANAFTCGFDSNDNVMTKSGWVDGKIVLPTSLKARVNKLNAQFKMKPHSERQQRATINRNQFMAERVAKSKAEGFKVEGAKAKRGMMTGSETGTFFNVNANPKDDSSSSGWGVRTRLPAHLAKRNNKLQQQFKKAPYAEREALATARREMFFEQTKNKARSTRSKGVGNKGMYSVVPADEEEFKMKPSAGWGKPNVMPQRLQQRVAFLNARFKREPYSVREEKAEFNRQAFNEHTKQFAKLNAMKAVNAAERRSEFQENMVIFSNSVSVSMPTKLAERSKFLQQKFAKKDTYEQRRFNAQMNRGKFNLEKSKAAATFSNRASSVQAQKKAFEVNMSLINVNGPVDSPVKMPKRLQKRVVELHEKFSYDPFKRAQRVEANRQSRLSMVRAKAARNTQRAEAAAARRAAGIGKTVESTEEVASTEDVQLETVKESTAKAVAMNTNKSGDDN